MGKERADMHFIQIIGMLFPMEKNVTLDPMDIAIFRSYAVMFAAKDIANLVQQAGFLLYLRQITRYT